MFECFLKRAMGIKDFTVPVSLTQEEKNDLEKLIENAITVSHTNPIKLHNYYEQLGIPLKDSKVSQCLKQNGMDAFLNAQVPKKLVEIVSSRIQKIKGELQTEYAKQYNEPVPFIIQLCYLMNDVSNSVYVALSGDYQAMQGPVETRYRDSLRNNRDDNLALIDEFKADIADSIVSEYFKLIEINNI